MPNNPQKLSQETIPIVDIFQDTQRTSGDREYIDSAHFHIIRGKYVSGAKFIEVYQNNLTKLDHWEEYYENGQLKEEGTMTTGIHTYVGIWKYYSYTGKLDSIIDHNKKFPISYFKALQIAGSKGFKMPDMELTLYLDSPNIYWDVSRWTEKNDHSGQTAETILIDVRSGIVTKPKFNRMSIY